MSVPPAVAGGFLRRYYPPATAGGTDKKGRTQALPLQFYRARGPHPTAKRNKHLKINGFLKIRGFAGRIFEASDSSTGANDSSIGSNH
jgi:hypothetical protein